MPNSSTTPIITYKYYPKLSSIINMEDFPEILGFIKDGITNLFDKIHFKDLQYSKSPRGDAAFYSLSIVAPNRIDIEIPGTGIFLILNPENTGGDSNISSFPITVEYEWQVLAYIREFSLGNFSFSPQEIFEIALRVLNISEEQAIAQFINTFTVPENDSISKIVQFVDDINEKYELTLPEPTDETTLSDIVTSIYEQTQGKYATLIGFGTYIMENDDLEETWFKLKSFFKRLLPDDIEEYIKNILIPKFRATLLLTAAIEFPRSILKPVYDINGVDPYSTTPSDSTPNTGNPLEVIPADAQDNPKVILNFGEALFYADTKKGFGYNMNIILNTNYPAQIGNTGLIIDIRNIKIDLSHTENILEANIDNRPPDFMGVFMEYTAIILPKKWFNDDEVVGGVTAKIAAYNLLIGTGGISGTVALETQTYRNNDGTILNYYTDYFQFEYPIQTTHNDVNNNLIVTNISSHTELKNQLEIYEATQFVLPLSLIKNGDIKPTVYENVAEYYTYLNTLYDTSDENNRPHLSKRFGDNGFEIIFERFDITFKQNVIINSNIKGGLKIPKLKNAAGNPAKIDITGHLYENGDFNITAIETTGLNLNLLDFVNFNIHSLEVGKSESHFYLGTSCDISFPNGIMNSILGDQKISIPNLRIYENGRMEILGGNAFIPTNISLHLGPIDMAVSGVHFGSYEKNGRQYNYWGFDGAISLDPLGVDARGSGIKYYYTVDDGERDSFLHIQSIEVDLVIPGNANPDKAVAIIHGMLSIPNPGQSAEYMGEISLKLPKAKISASAAMKLQPKYPAFVVDASVDLPSPIPLGPVAIYGFRGLLGYRYVAEKEAVGLVSGQNTWYEYYKFPPRGIHVSKFSGPDKTKGYNNPFSLGAGGIIGTGFDNGTVLSTRAMLLLSVPTLFMVEGRASILSKRLGLDGSGEPPFFAFIAWGDNSLEFGLGADFKLPKSNGWIFELYADVQAGFFFNNSSAWYVNFGTKQSPITAKVLSIITAKSYLMISAQGIEAGARVEFKLKKRFGPVKVYIKAYFEMGGFISFQSPQIGGYIALGGLIDIDVWIIGITIGLDALLSVEAAKPFLIYAELKIKVCVKVCCKKICKKITVKLEWKKDNTIDRTAIAPLPNGLGVNNYDQREELVKGVNMLTNETFKLDNLAGVPSSIDGIHSIIPLDTYIDIKTVKGLVPNALSNIGGLNNAPENYIDLIPPVSTVRGGRTIRQVKHKYSIESIEIKAHEGGNWVNYHPFKAVLKTDDPLIQSQVENLPIGFWQKSGKQYDTIRILATNPFSYIEAGEPGWFIPEQYGLSASTLFCQTQGRECLHSDVLNKPLGTVYYPPTQYVAHYINGAYYTLEGDYYATIDVDQNQVVNNDLPSMIISDVMNSHGFEKSLEFSNQNSLVIILPQVSVKTKLKISTFAQGVTLKYFKNDTDTEPTHEVYKTSLEIESTVESGPEINLIKKIIITPDLPYLDQINTIQSQIQELFDETYNSSEGYVDQIPKNQVLYNELLNQLQQLQQVGCTTIEQPCNPDEVLCTFYNNIINYNQYFPYPVTDLKTILPYLNNYSSFYNIIIEFDNDYQDYGLLEYLNPELTQYYELLDVVLSWPAGEPFNQAIYYEFRDLALAIIAKINTLGNCDCSNNNQITYCSTSFQEVCWLTIEDNEFNLNIPGQLAIQSDYNEMTQSVTQVIQPIWRPNTHYYMKFSLKDTVDNGSSEDRVFDYYYGFKTAGPIGHFHNAPGVTYGNEYDRFGNLLNRKDETGNISLDGSLTNPDNYPLTSLRSYIDYNRSYPNANGNLLQAKPLFYGNQQCKIDLYFIKPLVYHMFNSWKLSDGPDSVINNELYIAIKDPVTDVLIQYPLPTTYEETVPVPDASSLSWSEDENPMMPLSLQLINNLVNNLQIPLPCQIDVGETLYPASNYYSVTLTNLKPSKLYTALIYNVYNGNVSTMLTENDKKEVHRFVFQTSQFANFRQQVMSFQLKDMDENGNVINESQAVFKLNLPLSPERITSAYHVMNNQPDTYADDLSMIYHDKFDRIIEGIFEISPMNTAMTTEFNLIKNQSSGETVAILIRNPEPFNHPKIPIEYMIHVEDEFGNTTNKSVIRVVNSSFEEDTSYKILYSKDYSQVLIMRDSLLISANSLSFMFEYKTWNGSDYIVVEELGVAIDEKLHSVFVEGVNINI